MNELTLHLVDACATVSPDNVRVRPEPRGFGDIQAFSTGHALVMETAWFPTTKFGYASHSRRWGFDT